MDFPIKITRKRGITLVPTFIYRKIIFYLGHDLGFCHTVINLVSYFFFWGGGRGGILTRPYSCVNILAAILDAILNNGKGSSGNHGEF